MPNFDTMRAHMVVSQLRPNKVTDSQILEIFGSLPREHFVISAKRGVAYVDEDLEIGPNRYLMEPIVLARLIQAAAVTPADVALDIACGTGYATAILGHLADTVFGLEDDPELAKQATENLRKLGVDNAVVVEAPVARGYPDQAPFDVILLGGSVPAVPKELVNQLAEGGRLIAVVQSQPGMGEAILIQRSSGVVGSRVLFDAAIPPLPGFAVAPSFVF